MCAGADSRLADARIKHPLVGHKAYLAQSQNAAPDTFIPVATCDIESIPIAHHDQDWQHVRHVQIRLCKCHLVETDLPYIHPLRAYGYRTRNTLYCSELYWLSQG